MAVSIKAALLTSLFFISGMCSLVHQAARDTAGLPTPWSGGSRASLDAGSEPAAGPALAGSAERPSVRPLAWAERVSLDGRFARETALEREEAARPSGELLPPRELVFAPPSEPEALPTLADDLAAMSHVIESALRGEEPQIAALPAADEVLAIAGADPAAATESVAAPMNLPAADPVADGLVVSAAANDTYLVQRGDTLSGIAKRVWGTDSPQAVRALLAANTMLRGDANRLQAGNRLRIPESMDAPVPPAAAVAARGARNAKEPLVVRADKPAPATRSGSDARVYVIRSADTLEKIAERELRNPRRWKEIQKLNNLRDGDTIQAGRKLILPS